MTAGLTALLRAERAAQAILRAQLLAAAGDVDLRLLAFALGVVVTEGELRGAVARLVSNHRRGIVTLSRERCPGPRQNFTIAHELGHFLLHRRAGVGAVLTEVTIEDRPVRAIEREANAFASELLMPRLAWTAHADVARPELDHLRALADRYRVSLTSAAIRFVQLSPVPCAVAFCARGKVAWSERSASLKQAIPRNRPLGERTLAWGFLAGHPMPPRPTPVPASAWLMGPAWQGDAEVIEHCLPLVGGEGALSLLVVPERGMTSGLERASARLSG